MTSSKFSQLQRRFWRLAIVNVISNLMVPLASIIDTAFLGHLSEIRHLAGVAIASILFNYLYWTFGFLRMATTGTTAQATGRGQREEVILILLRNSLIALSIGSIILILHQPIRELGFALLRAAPEVIDSGRDYYNALIWGAPATLLNFVLFGWFLGREQATKVLLLSSIDKGANIALNYLFIVQWGWASAGAGWATAISQYFNLLVGLVVVAAELKLDWQPLIAKIWNYRAFVNAFKLNRDILIRTLALITTFAVFTNLSSAFGVEILAINTLLLQVVSLGAYFIDGIAFATESIAGSLAGEREKKQLWQLLQLAGGVSLSIGIGLAVVLVLQPESLFKLLTNHADVIAGTRRYVFWLIPVLGCGSIAYVLDGYFLGLTAGGILRKSTIVAAAAGFMPVAVAAWYWQSSHWLWLALSLFMAGRAITLGLKVPSTLTAQR